MRYIYGQRLGDFERDNRIAFLLGVVLWFIIGGIIGTGLALWVLCNWVRLSV